MAPNNHGESKQHASIAGLFLSRVETNGEHIALWTKPAYAVGFVSTTWNQLLADVWRTTQALGNRGIASQDRVANFCRNGRDWIVLDLALQLIGAWHVPISLHTPPDQLEFMLQQAQPKLMVATEPHPHISESVCIEPSIESPETPTTSEMHSTLFALQSKIDPAATCTMVYTSGTSDVPKGVLLSYSNLYSNAMALAERYAERPADVRLNFLPFSHLYARTCDVYTWIARGSQLAIATSRETILNDLQQVEPSLVNGVPYFYEKIATRLTQVGKSGRPALEGVFGKNIRMLTTGGASLAPWVGEFYEACGMPILEGYGLTETSPVVSVSTENERRAGSVGRPLDGVLVRISSEDEIEIQGPNVMQAYYQSDGQPLTSDHWFKTGDLGRLDEDGFLWITGRKKEMIVLSTGRKVNPIQLEQRIVQHPLIAQVVVCGEGKKCLSALIVPQPEELKKRIREARLWVFSKRQALSHRRVVGWFREALDQQLADRAEYERIGPFRLLGQGFTPESGEMTPKLSLRRPLIFENYRSLIDTMYQTSEVSKGWWPFMFA